MIRITIVFEESGKLEGEAGVLMDRPVTEWEKEAGRKILTYASDLVMEKSGRGSRLIEETNEIDGKPMSL